MKNKLRANDATHINRNAGAGPRVMSASTLAGDKVRNPQGENLGDIKEIMLDTESGHVAYAVLSFGGVLGMGEKLFAVPWNALRLDTEDKCFILDATKEQLKDAPGFDKDNWPNMADRAWGHRIHEYYGTKHYSDTELPRL